MSHIHNALHQFGTVQDGYRRAVGETGPEFGGIERGGESLLPIIDLWSRPEFAYLRREYLFHDTNTEAAGAAGTRSFVQLHNDSLNALVVVTYLYAIAGTTSIRVSRSNVQGTSDDGLCLARDGRLSKPDVPFARQRSQTIALPAGISAGEFWSSDSAGPFMGDEFPLPFILRPGSVYSVYSAADQTAVRVNWGGWVRTMLPGEQVGLSE